MYIEVIYIRARFAVRRENDSLPGFYGHFSPPLKFFLGIKNGASVLIFFQNIRNVKNHLDTNDPRIQDED